MIRLQVVLGCCRTSCATAKHSHAVSCSGRGSRAIEPVLAIPLLRGTLEKPALAGDVFWMLTLPDCVLYRWYPTSSDVLK